MVGNTGNLMTMRIVRNKVHSQDDTIVTSTTTTTTTTNEKDEDNNKKDTVGGEHKPQSSFKRGHKHLSISFRLPKNHHHQHNNFDENDDMTTTTTTTTTTNQTSNILGKSRFFINHFNYHHHNKNNNNTTTTTTTTTKTTIINNNDDTNQVVGFTRTSGIGILPSNTWVFPPHAPTPNIYHCLNTEELLAANDNGGFKGFRKQFSGRFKRLVAAKKPEPSPVIPPHLKPQLKTIYVY